MRYLCALIAIAVALALPAMVLGHAGLVESDPADGATITTPYTLTATFEEEIDLELSSLTVENTAGEIVASGDVDPEDPARITAELPALPDGVYTVRWTTVTPDDSGIERGTFTFSVGAHAHPTVPPDDAATGSTNDVLLAIGLAVVIIAVVIGFVVIRGRR